MPRGRTKQAPSKKLSQDNLAKFVRHYSAHGNATKAVLDLHEGKMGYETARTKGSRWLNNADVQQALQYVHKRLSEGSTVAVDRIVYLAANSESEKIALEASKYLVDQSHGKAITRVENQTTILNIDTVLDMSL